MIRAGASNFPQSEDGILARGLFFRAPRATQVDIVKMLSPNNPWAARNYSQAQKSRQARQAAAGKTKPTDGSPWEPAPRQDSQRNVIRWLDPEAAL